MSHNIIIKTCIDGSEQTQKHHKSKTKHSISTHLLFDYNTWNISNYHTSVWSTNTTWKSGSEQNLMYSFKTLNWNTIKRKGFRKNSSHERSALEKWETAAVKPSKASVCLSVSWPPLSHLVIFRFYQGRLVTLTSILEDSSDMRDVSSQCPGMWSDLDFKNMHVAIWRACFRTLSSLQPGGKKINETFLWSWTVMEWTMTGRRGEKKG